MELLPHFPLHLNPVFIFGLTILLGLVGGELATRTHFLPVITGYIIVSFLMGPGGFNIANASVLEISRLFVDISLSLILFELGRHLDFRWLCRDRGLLLTAIAEASFTFVIIFFLSYFLATLSILESAFAATISMSTSPAVVMMIAYDTSSEGPVTRRSLILTSTNNCFALILFTFLLFFTLPNDSILENFYRIIYRFLGSFIFGLCMFGVTAILGSLLGKNKDNQFILFIGIVILTTSLGRMFHLSNMIALFTLGVAARNLDKKHILVEVNFEWLARLFLIVLFVVTGVQLQLPDLGLTGIIVLMFILARWIAKFSGIWLFSNKSNLTKAQVIAISLALSPMAAVAIGLTNILENFNPHFGHRLLVIMTSVVAILNIIGPILTQLAFIQTGEALRTLTYSQESRTQPC